MKLLKSGFYYLAVLLVIISVLNQEVDARRKILRGRKVITRTYYKSASIPAWAIILIVGLGMLVVGGAAYGILNKMFVEPAKEYSPPAARTHTYAPAPSSYPTTP